MRSQVKVAMMTVGLPVCGDSTLLAALCTSNIVVPVASALARPVDHSVLHLV